MENHEATEPIQPVEGRTPSPVAQRVAAAFRAAAKDAVDVNLRRGHTVVGVVDGVWTEKTPGR